MLHSGSHTNVDERFLPHLHLYTLRGRTAFFLPLVHRNIEARVREKTARVVFFSLLQSSAGTQRKTATEIHRYFPENTVHASIRLDDGAPFFCAAHNGDWCSFGVFFFRFRMFAHQIRHCLWAPFWIGCIFMLLSL